MSAGVVAFSDDDGHYVKVLILCVDYEYSNVIIGSKMMIVIMRKTLLCVNKVL